MFHDKRELFWYAKRAGVIGVALVLGLLAFGSYAAALPKPGGALPALPNSDKDQESTRVFQHTYDEVFQASQEAIERMGLFLIAKDKDKGTINGNGKWQAQRPAAGVGCKCSFDIHIETLNTKPETQVTINAKGGCALQHSLDMNSLKSYFFSELQKVLSTYH